MEVPLLLEALLRAHIHQVVLENPKVFLLLSIGKPSVDQRVHRAHEPKLVCLIHFLDLVNALISGGLKEHFRY